MAARSRGHLLRSCKHRHTVGHGVTVLHIVLLLLLLLHLLLLCLIDERISLLHHKLLLLLRRHVGHVGLVSWGRRVLALPGKQSFLR